MKYIRLISDIHLDFDIAIFDKIKTVDVSAEGDMSVLWYPIPMEEDDETTLVIAGDIWYGRKFLKRRYKNGDSWLKRVSANFKYVVFVLGNHDYWGQNLSFEPQLIREEILEQGILNAHLLEKNSIVLDNVKFLGGTLWTDFNKSPLVMMQASGVMTPDYKYIKIGPNWSRLRPEPILGIFNKTVKFIFENGKKDHPQQRVVCVTHMAPSLRSIAPQFANSSTNPFYYSDLDIELCYEEHDISLWFHGHTHVPLDYVLHEKTRVVCNPRGYSSERVNFDPLLRFDV